jgi:hypothetical protein
VSLTGHANFPSRLKSATATAVGVPVAVEFEWGVKLNSGASALPYEAVPRFVCVVRVAAEKDTLLVGA